jgi:site-specific DNA-methyltransferase (adenine-specific)
MRPYYEQDGIVIYHGDCREILGVLPGQQVNAVITDPPYGIALANHAAGRERSAWAGIRGDEDGAVGNWIVRWCESLCLPLVIFANPMRPWPGRFDQMLVWDKGPAVGGGGDPATRWKQTHESILVARTGKLNGQRDCAVLTYWTTPQASADHPAAKPEALMLYLVAKVSNAGDVIVDPCCGSGTTLVAAKRLCRRAIGIEIEERYCEIAARRLAQGVLNLEAAV